MARLTTCAESSTLVARRDAAIPTGNPDRVAAAVTRDRTPISLPVCGGCLDDRRVVEAPPAGRLNEADRRLGSHE